MILNPKIVRSGTQLMIDYLVSEWNVPSISPAHSGTIMDFDEKSLFGSKFLTDKTIESLNDSQIKDQLFRV